MSERESMWLYCVNCTDSQLENVYRDEKRRARDNKDTGIGETALVFASLALEELVRRGLR